jgi:hypothetical protein
MTNQPIQVQSCWNGITVFDAAPFYSKHPLRFRGVSDSLAKKHVEGSECCLIHADNPLSAIRGVWLNPNVRVGYGESAYHTVNPGHSANWVSTTSKVFGMWKNRWARLYGAAKRRSEHWVIKKRILQWKSEVKDEEIIQREGEKDNAVNCLINEMQVLVKNGWAHI